MRVSEKRRGGEIGFGDCAFSLNLKGFAVCEQKRFVFSRRPSGFQSRGKHAPEMPQEAFMQLFFSFKGLVLIDMSSPMSHLTGMWRRGGWGYTNSISQLPHS